MPRSRRRRYRIAQGMLLNLLDISSIQSRAARPLRRPAKEA